MYGQSVLATGPIWDHPPRRAPETRFIRSARLWGVWGPPQAFTDRRSPHFRNTAPLRQSLAFPPPFSPSQEGTKTTPSHLNPRLSLSLSLSHLQLHLDSWVVRANKGPPS